MAWKECLILAFAQACFTDGMNFFFSRHKTAISSSQWKIWKRYNKKGEWNTKGISKRKISFLIPLAFSFRAVNTVLWKVNIDQHDTSVEQRQNLSTCLGLNPWPLERWEVMGPIPVGDSDQILSLFNVRVMLINSPRDISLLSLKFTIFFHLSIQFCLSFSLDDLLHVRERNGASSWLPKVRLSLTASTIGQK